MYKRPSHLSQIQKQKQELIKRRKRLMLLKQHELKRVSNEVPKKEKIIMIIKYER